MDRLQRLSSAVREPQPDALGTAGPGNAGAVLDAICAQARCRLLAGFPDPQARRTYPRANAVYRAQAIQRVVSDQRIDLAVLPAIRIAGCECQSSRGQG